MTSVHPPKILEEKIGLSSQKINFRMSFGWSGVKNSLRFPGAQTDLMIILIFCIKDVAKKHFLILGLFELNTRKNIRVGTWGICAIHKKCHIERKNASAKPRAEIMMFACMFSQNKLASYWNSFKTSWKQWEDSHWFQKAVAFTSICAYACFIPTKQIHRDQHFPQKALLNACCLAEWAQQQFCHTLNPQKGTSAPAPATHYIEQWVMAWDWLLGSL